MMLRHGSRRQRATLFKLCSLLLCYPDEQLLAARADLACEAPPALEGFCRWWATEDPMALQQHYVELFDLHKRCGLYLSFYSEGDKRARGESLLRLKRLYRAAGLPLESGELPDYLPVMLEFAATASPPGRGELVLREHHAALTLLCGGLRERGTPYAEVLEAVCGALGDVPAADRQRAAALAAAGPPTELVGIEPMRGRP